MAKCFGNPKGRQRLILMEEIGEAIMEGHAFELRPPNVG